MRLDRSMVQEWRKLHGMRGSRNRGHRLLLEKVVLGQCIFGDSIVLALRKTRDIVYCASNMLFVYVKRHRRQGGRARAGAARAVVGGEAGLRVGRAGRHPARARGLRGARVPQGCAYFTFSHVIISLLKGGPSLRIGP
jgi:hypothetical protein